VQLLYETRGRASVAACFITIVTLLGTKDGAISTNCRTSVWLTGVAGKTVLQLAVPAASISSVGVTVVAGFTYGHDAIAAALGTTSGVGVQIAIETCFQGTACTAAIAANLISIVASFGFQNKPIAAACPLGNLGRPNGARFW
jgi:hypothetical protein